MNCVTKIAQERGRDYIVPSDVSDAFRSNPVDQVRLDALEVLGKITEFGAEDSGLCAFIAWRGTPDEEKDV